MPSAYTTLLGLVQPTTGELSGTWGTTVNQQLTQLVEDAIAGFTTFDVTAGDYTLSTTGSGAQNEARMAVLVPTGTPGVSRDIYAPKLSKVYVVVNRSDAEVVLRGGPITPTTGTVIPAGVAQFCLWDPSAADFRPVGTPMTSSTGAMVVPSGTTAQRDSTPVDGYLRYNSQTLVFEGRVNGAWVTLADTGNVVDLTTSQSVAGVKTFTSGVVLASANSGQLAGLRNILINGAFYINQRQASSNADDTYAHDRWYVLTQTSTIAVSTLTDVENGTPFMARLTQSQATAQRMGYAQIIEGKDCKHLRGKEATFRFGRERLSSSANVRIAVLEWTGTEDTVTSDVVNDWNSGTYTPGNFFIGSNLTVSGVVQQALTANTLADGSEVTVTLGSSFNNLIVFIWTEGAVAQNVTLDLAAAQLEIGAVATPFERRPLSLELALCQRYYQKSYAIDVVPGTAYTPLTANDNVSDTDSGAGGGNVSATADLKVEMRTAPTTIYYSHTGVANNISYWLNGTTWLAIAPSATVSTAKRVYANYGSGSANNSGISYGFTASAEL